MASSFPDTGTTTNDSHPAMIETRLDSHHHTTNSTTHDNAGEEERKEAAAEIEEELEEWRKREYQQAKADWQEHLKEEVERKVKWRKDRVRRRMQARKDLHPEWPPVNKEYPARGIVNRAREETLESERKRSEGMKDLSREKKRKEEDWEKLLKKEKSFFRLQKTRRSLEVTRKSEEEAFHEKETSKVAAWNADVKKKRKFEVECWSKELKTAFEALSDTDAIHWNLHMNRELAEIHRDTCMAERYQDRIRGCMDCRDDRTTSWGDEIEDFVSNRGEGWAYAEPEAKFGNYSYGSHGYGL